jgi:hypothetical protein
VNGDAIHGTRPWRRVRTTREGVGVRFTAKGSTTHAILLATPSGGVRIRDFTRAHRHGELLGHGAVAARAEGGDLVVAWPRASRRRRPRAGVRGGVRRAMASSRRIAASSNRAPRAPAP